ncbi:unnamed protein product [Oppiella nova]|uniref:Nicotinamide riboside kinase 1 n=1 Tax=Oppiella nova TaxID=334625 RepID=A0A7R9QF14_9ACAR|nr:unnamed protein product [Oppiella nova]CAG2163715.1 unnamed protein product [Oppiella nova]
MAHLVTCGGKSTLADRLQQQFEHCVIISQDQFFRADDDPNHEWIDVSPTIRHQNWESMASMDWEAFARAIDVVLSKEPPNHSALLIIEGHMIYNYKPICDLCDKKFFITLEKDECFARRDGRTYLPPDPIGYFDAWVWPLYLQNMEHMKSIQNDIPIDY